MRPDHTIIPPLDNDPSIIGEHINALAEQQRVHTLIFIEEGNEYETEEVAEAIYMLCLEGLPYEKAYKLACVYYYANDLPRLGLPEKESFAECDAITSHGHVIPATDTSAALLLWAHAVENYPIFDGSKIGDKELRVIGALRLKGLKDIYEYISTISNGIKYPGYTSKLRLTHLPIHAGDKGIMDIAKRINGGLDAVLSALNKSYDNSLDSFITLIRDTSEELHTISPVIYDRLSELGVTGRGESIVYMLGRVAERYMGSLAHQKLIESDSESFFSDIIIKHAIGDIETIELLENQPQKLFARYLISVYLAIKAADKAGDTVLPETTMREVKQNAQLIISKLEANGVDIWREIKSAYNKPLHKVISELIQTVEEN